MYIGKINRIFDYDKWLVRVADKEEARDVLIGDFVKINDSLVGAVVGNHQDIPDDYLARNLSGEVSNEIFINELDEEKAYYRVLGIGEIKRNSYGVKKPPSLKDEVYTLSDEEIREFHIKDGETSFSYYSDIIDFEKIDPEIIINLLDKLEDVFSDRENSKKIIKALKKHTRRIKK